MYLGSGIRLVSTMVTCILIMSVLGQIKFSFFSYFQKYRFNLFRIKSAIGTRTIKTYTSGASKTYYKRLYPSSREAGLFQVVSINDMRLANTGIGLCSY